MTGISGDHDMASVQLLKVVSTAVTTESTYDIGGRDEILKCAKKTVRFFPKTVRFKAKTVRFRVDLVRFTPLLCARFSKFV